MAIKENKNGTVTIDYRDKDGKRYRETFTGSKTLAKEVLRKRQTEIAEGRFFPNKKKEQITFKEIAEKYWQIHGSKTKGALQLKYLLQEIRTRFDNKKVSAITVEDVQEFYNDTLARTSPSTAKRYFSQLRAIINKAITLRIYKGTNPCIGVVRQRENAPRKAYLTKEQINRLIQKASGKILPLLKFAIATGMRRGEILNVDWSELDFNANIIHIYKSKSGKGRDVPMLEALKKILLDMGPQTKGKVFPITIPALRKEFDKALKAAGISGIRFHDLRHTFASHFMMNGGNITDLQNILGHSSAELTARYAHLSPYHLKQAIAVVEDIVPSNLVLEAKPTLQLEQQN